MDGVMYTSYADGSETSRKATDEEVLLADALLRTSDELRVANKRIESYETLRNPAKGRLVHADSAHEPQPAASNSLLARLRLAHAEHCRQRSLESSLLGEAADELEAQRAEIIALRCLLADEGYEVGAFTGNGKPLFSRPTHEPRKDHCEVCDKELPHVDEWSMPSCPDCQEVLEFLGELQCDYADREREGKAELVGSAIKLICRHSRAAQPPPSVPAQFIQRIEHELSLYRNDSEWMTDDTALLRLLNLLNGVLIHSRRAAQPPAPDVQMAMALISEVDCHLANAKWDKNATARRKLHQAHALLAPTKGAKP
jgi:hypothetical protein